MSKSGCFLYKVLLGSATLSMGACQPGQSPVAGKAPVAKPVALAVASPPLGKTDYRLSIPPRFALKVTNGADFLVYCFTPANTTVQADFSGGLYLGNFPRPQDEPNDTLAGCRVRRVAVTLLGHPATVSIRRCATGYTLNSVFDSHSGYGWDTQVNAFGEAKSAAGLR